MGISYAPSIRTFSGVERATLVRRTYGLVFLGVIVTIIGTAFTLSQPAMRDAVMEHPFITMLCTFVPLFLVRRAPRAFPQNVLLMLLFTFMWGMLLAAPMAMAEISQPGVVGEAGLLTFVTFGALSMYAALSRRDFSAWGAFFGVGLIVLVVTSVLSMFFHSATSDLWLSAMTLLVFSGLLVFDTWRILRSGAYGPDDYVMAAVQIYMDLLNMFLAILNLLSGKGRR